MSSLTDIEGQPDSEQMTTQAQMRRRRQQFQGALAEKVARPIMAFPHTLLMLFIYLRTTIVEALLGSRVARYVSPDPLLPVYTPKRSAAKVAQPSAPVPKGAEQYTSLAAGPEDV